MNAVTSELSIPEDQSVPSRRFSVASVILAVLYCAGFWYLGRASAAFTEIFRSFGETGWQVDLLDHIQFIPTITVGSGVAALIIWKDRVASRRFSRTANITGLGIFLVIIARWAYAAFSPIFVIHCVVS
jgi:hypothetical protein